MMGVSRAFVRFEHDDYHTFSLVLIIR